MTTDRPSLILRTLLLAGGLALLVAGPAAAQPAPCPSGEAPASVCSFVDDAPPYDAHIEHACALGLMAGCGGDYFCPDEGVTREDMAVHLETLYRGSAFTPLPACASACTFTDLTPSYCLAGWICQLARDGITGGYADGSYGGPRAVTRAHMAAFLSKVLAWRLGETIPSSGTVCRTPSDCRAFDCKASGGTSAFSDVPAALSFCKSIHYIFGKGITAGCAVWQYCPSSTIARKEMAVFLGRSATLVEATPPPTTNPCQ